MSGTFAGPPACLAGDALTQPSAGQPDETEKLFVVKFRPPLDDVIS